MKEYITPEMKIKKLTFEDIVCTSGGGEGGIGQVVTTQPSGNEDDGGEQIDGFY